MFKSYYVPEFPIQKITDDGRDLWINDPNHIRHQYGFLDAILEHIDNAKHIDPVKITIHNEREVHCGPSGTSRLYALTYKKGYTHIPAIVSTVKCYEWFGENVVEIKDKNQIISYLSLEPVDYGISDNGNVYWHNQNPNPEQASKTLKVSKETLDRFLKCI